MSANSSDQSVQARAITIVVNGRAVETSEKELTFGQLVSLVFPSQNEGGMTIYTITFRRGNGEKPEGTLVDGQSVKLKDGMIFNVTATDKS